MCLCTAYPFEDGQAFLTECPIRSLFIRSVLLFEFFFSFSFQVLVLGIIQRFIAGTIWPSIQCPATFHSFPVHAASSQCSSKCPHPGCQRTEQLPGAAATKRRFEVQFCSEMINQATFSLALLPFCLGAVFSFSFFFFFFFSFNCLSWQTNKGSSWCLVSFHWFHIE